MLESIREKSQGLVSKVILGLVILTFAVAGIGSYNNTVDTSVAEVNGESISQNDFNKAFQSQRNRMAQQYGDMFETLTADSNYMANFRNGVLDNLINERLIDQNAAAMSIRVSDEQLKETIVSMPEFQVNGTFDNNRYLAMINQAGFYQSSDFRDYLRVQMTRRQLSQALVVSEFSLPYQEEMLASLQNQTRDLRVLNVVAEQFKAGVEVSEEEINTYYLANQNQFQNQEQVMVDYVVLDVNEIAKTIEVSDSDIETYYQENIANYRDDEQRKIAHIMIELGDDEASAKALIDGLLVRLNAGEDFAELAKEYSTDTFSGENGGDLGWMESGTLDDNLEETAYALVNVGDVSEVVISEYGYHIIKLTDFKVEKIQALSAVRDDVAEQVSKNKAQDKYFELQQELSRLAYEFPDTLDDAAGAVDAPVKTSPWLTRGANVAPFNDSKVIDTAFSELVLNENLNSDVIEVNDELAIVLRLNQHQAANAKPLAEVSELIKSLLITQKASDKTQEVADSILAKLTKAEDLTADLAAINATFEDKLNISRYASELDMSVSREAFALPHPKEGVVSAGSAALSNGDISIVQVIKVTVGENSANDKINQQQTNLLAQSAYKSFVESLAQNAEITKKTLGELPAQQY